MTLDPTLQAFSEALTTRFPGARQANIERAYKLYTAADHFPWDLVGGKSSLIPSHASWSAETFKQDMNLFLDKNWRVRRGLKKMVTMDPSKPQECLKYTLRHGEMLSTVTKKQEPFNVALQQMRSHTANASGAIDTVIAGMNAKPTNPSSSLPESTGMKVTRGAGVMAGVGFIGHGLFSALNDIDADPNGNRQRRNWDRTLLHLGEAGMGAGLTWASLVAGKGGPGSPAR